jgi:hypothetical protein
MANNTELPRCNVVPFPSEERRAVGERVSIASESWDHGPSPEESLRIMRAFVGIKNRKLRADMIEMLEGASRARGHAPAPGKD